MDFDVPRLEWLLAEAFDAGDLATTVDEWLLPALVAPRHGVAARRGVGGRRALRVRRRAPPARARLPVPAAPAPADRGWSSGCPRGARHELGVLAFASVLRSRGVSVTYLGGDLPLEAWVGAVRLIAPAAVVLAAPTVEDLPAVREAVEALTPLTTVLLGGAHQDLVEGPSTSATARAPPRRRWPTGSRRPR